MQGIGLIRFRKPRQKPEVRQRLAIDSEFYLIGQRLAELGFARHSCETLSAWLERIGAAPLPGLSTETLRPLLALHYRYRFDPQGLSPAAREELAAAVTLWLEQHTSVGKTG